MKLEWVHRALRDRSRQLDYIGERNPRAASAIGARLETSLERLVHFPSSGRPGRVAETRELVVYDTPFVVVYRVERTAVVILRVLHAAQNYPSKS